MAGAKNPKRKKRARREHDWDGIREDFLLQNLDPSREKPYTLGACAKSWAVSVSAVERHSRKEGWRDELRVRAKAQANANIERRQETYAEVEAEIRQRHATFCRGLIAKAGIKFTSITDPRKLTVDQMLKMLTFAMPEEREARGIPKYYQVTGLTPTDPEREMETPGMRIERRRIERQVGKELTALLAGVESDDD